jgi:two-component system, chemotaxis family, CheB/CheR fusion protein
MPRTVSREAVTPLPAKPTRKKSALPRSARHGAGPKSAPKPAAALAHANDFPVVGIGASVGGLQAFRELLDHLPPDTGMAFVLVQHLDPLHKSALSELLGKSSPLPVAEVTRNTRVLPNHVYVIPPNRALTFEKGSLKLRPRPTSAEGHRTIDTFFESLAAERQAGAIGVVLSGAATDGTLGLEAIKAEGGITFAQDQSATNESMPRSAVAAGVVDFVLSPAKIAAELGRMASHPFLHAAPVLKQGKLGRNETRRMRAADTTKSDVADNASDAGKVILGVLARHSGVDFNAYKSSTIERRIRRRMVLSRLSTLEEYAERLKNDAAEVELLYSDVLIHVTSFFRNPETFEFLKSHVLPKLFRRESEQTVRVWVAGCSTGQEAYSIAMLLSEAAGRRPGMPAFQVFATDLNAAYWKRRGPESTQSRRSGISHRRGCVAFSSRKTAGTGWAKPCAT